MPFNGSGTFTVYTPGTPYVTGTTISSTVANNVNSDFATGLSTAITKNGQTTITANIPFSGFKITGLGAATVLTDAIRADQVQNNVLNYLTSVAGTNTITGNAAITPAAYVAGQKFTFIPANDNTGAATLNVSSLGAGAIQSAGSPLIAGDLQQNVPVQVLVTTSTPVFEIIGTSTSGFARLASENDFTANQTISSTDTGATANPTLTLYRNSASPADGDDLGIIVFSGNITTGSATAFAAIYADAVDVTAASADGRIGFKTVIAGTYADRAYVGAGLYMAGATGGDQGANTVNASALYDDGVQVRPLVIATETAAGGTATPFTGIPSGVIRITINFQAWSTNGTSPWLIQIGDSGGIENSGYASVAGSGSGATANTAGFMIHEAPSAGAVYSGRIVLERINSNSTTWISTGLIADTSGGTGMRISGGQKSLTTELTQLQFTTAGGADVSDNGTINITYQ